MVQENMEFIRQYDPVIGGIMFASVKAVSLLTPAFTWSSLLAEIGAGAAVYTVLSGVYVSTREKELWAEITKRIPFLNRI